MSGLAAGLCHPQHLAQSHFPAREVAQTVAHRDDVEGVICKWNTLRIAANEVRSWCDLLRRLRFPASDYGCPSRGTFQHATAEIQASDYHAGRLDHALLPMPVQAKTLEIVDQVVARRDAGEELVNLRSALFARIEERIGHGARSLRQTLVPGDPNLPAGGPKLECVLLQTGQQWAAL